MTHAHFDQDGMDEVDNQITDSGGWIFGRYNDFYSDTQNDYFLICTQLLKFQTFQSASSRGTLPISSMTLTWLPKVLKMCGSQRWGARL